MTKTKTDTAARRDTLERAHRNASPGALLLPQRPAEPPAPPPPGLQKTPDVMTLRAMDQMLQRVQQAFIAMLEACEPPRQRCWPCFTRRHAWNTAHGGEWAAAQQAAREAAGIPEGQDVPFALAIEQLAEELRPDIANPTGAGTDRMPAAFTATVTVGGTGYCDADAELVADARVPRRAVASESAEPAAATA